MHTTPRMEQHGEYQLPIISQSPNTSISAILGSIEVVVGDTIYFSADSGHGTVLNYGLTTVPTIQRCAADIRTYCHNTGSWPANGHLIGETQQVGNGNGNCLRITQQMEQHGLRQTFTLAIYDSDPGEYLSIVVGDTIYFDADDGSTGRELWAYNTSNETSWQVINIAGTVSSNPGDTMEILVGDTIYFNAYDSNTGYLWNVGTQHLEWNNMASGGLPFTGHSNAYIGTNLIGDPVVIGDTIFTRGPDSHYWNNKELWAHDTSNHSTWQVSNLSGGSSSKNIGSYVFLALGDTLYFSHTYSNSYTLWAYDTSTNPCGIQAYGPVI